MANSAPYTSQYDNLPKIVRILLQIFLGVLVGGIYRIIRFFESGNIVTLVVGILVTFTGVGNFIIWVVDLITTIFGDGIVVLAA
jgi:hypothetical protein